MPVSVVACAWGADAGESTGGVPDRERHRMICIDRPRAATCLFKDVFRTIVDDHDRTGTVHMIQDKHVGGETGVARA